MYKIEEYVFLGKTVPDFTAYLPTVPSGNSKNILRKKFKMNKKKEEFITVPLFVLLFFVF